MRLRALFEFNSGEIGESCGTQTPVELTAIIDCNISNRDVTRDFRWILADGRGVNSEFVYKILPGESCRTFRKMRPAFTCACFHGVGFFSPIDRFRGNNQTYRTDIGFVTPSHSGRSASV